MNLPRFFQILVCFAGMAHVLSPATSGAGVIEGHRAGLVPNRDEDCTVAFQKVVDELCRRPGSTLRLAPGTYHFHAASARERIDFQSNTTVVSPRRYAILIENARGLTIDGRGATLVMHGEMSAIGVEGSDRVTVRNLNVDWDRLLTSQATVVEQGTNGQVVTIDAVRFPYVVEDGKLAMVVEGRKSRVWATMEIDPANGRNLGDGGGISRAEEIAPGKLRIWGARRVEKVGHVLALRHHVRSHAAMFIHDSRRVRIENTEVWGSCGLGLLFQASRDLTLVNTAVRPRPGAGLLVGPKDDGFHFSGCSGNIRVERCRVEGTPDDPINIHGTCLPVDAQSSGRTLRAHFGHEQSIGQHRWGRPGEVVTVVDRRTLLPVQTNVIASFRLLDAKNVEVMFEKDFPSPVTTGHVLENLSATPGAVIRDCWFGNNRARGILCSTPRQVVIEDNTFVIQGAAILIAGDANGWYESGAVGDVLIRRNVFDNCLIAPTQFSDGVIAIWPEIHQDVPGRYFHRNIRIERNTFKVFDRPILYAHNVDGLTFRRNEILRTEFRPPWHRLRDAMRLQHCRDVRIEKNRTVGELLSTGIAHPDTPASEIVLDARSPFRLVSNPAK